jgi:predicted MFS family arabinose efflux permease
VISAFSVSYAAMIAGRLIIGAGSGLAISGANAAVAAREDAERIFAIIWTMGGGLYAVLAVSLPLATEGGNYPLGFGGLLVLCLAALPFILWIPPKPDPSRALPTLGNDQATTHTPDDTEPEIAKPFGLLSLTAIFGMFIYSAGEQALWTFAYNLPIENGVDPTLASQILACITLFGLVGGGIAALIGVRLGRVMPIVVGTLLSAIGRWLYISAAGTGTLLAAAVFWGLGFYFVSPYQIGIAAALDRKGRVAVASAAAMNFGYAVGPGMAGRILQYTDRDWLMAVIAGSTLASMVLILPLAIRVERASKGKR